MNRLMTALELSEWLRVSPETVKVWAREGLIPVIRIRSNLIRFDVDEVRHALESHGAREALVHAEVSR